MINKSELKEQLSIRVFPGKLTPAMLLEIADIAARPRYKVHRKSPKVISGKAHTQIESVRGDIESVRGEPVEP